MEISAFKCCRFIFLSVFKTFRFGFYSFMTVKSFLSKNALISETNDTLSNNESNIIPDDISSGTSSRELEPKKWNQSNLISKIRKVSTNMKKCYHLVREWKNQAHHIFSISKKVRMNRQMRINKLKNVSLKSNGI